MRRHDTDTFATIPRTGKPTSRIAAAGVALLAILALVFSLTARPVAYAENASAQGAQSATVLVYMNGSDLETWGGEASADIAEMVASGAGARANVLIETLGTSAWQDFGIASDHTQRYRVNQGSLELVDDSLGQLDTTDPVTLSDFIEWGTSNYPADRYMLVFWNHGAGPVYGFGYDEFQSEESALTLDEMKQAFNDNPGVHFDFIGMDCCIMGSLETCVALKPYCDYLVASEDFEPGVGWSYSNWLRTLDGNPGVETAELGRVIVDDMIAAVSADSNNGEATLALVDESAVDELFSAWTSFAYANEAALLDANYSQQVEWRDRPEMGGESHYRPHGFEDPFAIDWSGSWGSDWDEWNYDGSYVTMTDYFVTDVAEVASTIDSDQASELLTAFDDALAYFSSTSGEEGMSGLGVTLPYGDAEFYRQLTEVFKGCDIDGDYVDWLEAFVTAQGAGDFYDFGESDYHGFDYDAYDLSYDLYEDYGFYDDGYDFYDDFGFYDEGYDYRDGYGDSGSYHAYDVYDYGYHGPEGHGSQEREGAGGYGTDRNDFAYTFGRLCQYAIPS